MFSDFAGYSGKTWFAIRAEEIWAGGTRSLDGAKGIPRKTPGTAPISAS